MRNVMVKIIVRQHGCRFKAAASWIPLHTSTQTVRSQSTSTRPTPPPSTPNPKWLSDTKARIGKCLTFGLPPHLIDEASSILSVIANDWRSLTAGAEGYLTMPTRAGLHRQPIVWGEQDSMGHVNNVMYVRYAESGRTNWTRNFGKYFDVEHKRQWGEMLTSRGVGLILKSITVDFKFPMTWPDRISVYHKIRDQPHSKTDSIILDVMILSEVKQRPAARCLEDVVVYDYRAGRKSALPPFMLEQFTKVWELQEQEKRANSEKASKLLDRVVKLEKESWDREGAVESFGP